MAHSDDIPSTQSIRNQTANTTGRIIEVAFGEFLANFSVARNQAIRDNMPGVAERMENDLEVFESLKDGDLIIIRAYRRR